MDKRQDKQWVEDIRPGLVEDKRQEEGDTSQGSLRPGLVEDKHQVEEDTLLEEVAGKHQDSHPNGAPEEDKEEVGKHRSEEDSQHQVVVVDTLLEEVVVVHQTLFSQVGMLREHQDNLQEVVGMHQGHLQVVVELRLLGQWAAVKMVEEVGKHRSEEDSQHQGHLQVVDTLLEEVVAHQTLFSQVGMLREHQDNLQEVVGMHQGHLQVVAELRLLGQWAAVMMVVEVDKHRSEEDSQHQVVVVHQTLFSQVGMLQEHQDNLQEEVGTHQGHLQVVVELLRLLGQWAAVMMVVEVDKHRSEEDSQHQGHLQVVVALLPRDTQKKTVAAADPAGLGVVVVGRLQELKVALLLNVIQGSL